jgi:hypothetical protein
MRRLAWLLPLLALGACDARSDVETAVAFAVIIGSLARIFVEPKS